MNTLDGRLELWGGAECTINRVGARFFSQLETSGHGQRLDDLDRIVGLGIRTIRFPLLWEQLAPKSMESIDWSWADVRMARLRELGVRPIVGLLHHGSGPAYTNLLDPLFPQKLALFARAVAERYPWVEDYTPINEPLTTARFSGLYGHWYPHRADALSFCRMLLAQVRGVVLAMRAIREITPTARLIQTEDLSRTLAPPILSEQVHFENERRWVVFDLLNGSFDERGVVASYLRHVGIAPAELSIFADEPCVPSVIGVNHYVTSSRYLDPDVDRFPVELRGGNGREVYVDVEAARTRAVSFPEPAALLREVWKRYQIPVAITEAHLSCTREEQIRWLGELWNAALSLRSENIPIAAVTVWSLFGSYDWDSLLTESMRHYEPGAFDLRGPAPRPTALATAVQDLASTGRISSPLQKLPGWWRRPIRVLPSREERLAAARLRVPSAYIPPASALNGTDSVPLILITGASGELSQAFARLCGLRGLPYRLLGQQEMEITDAASVEAAIQAFRPWAIVNAAGWTQVDEAEAGEDACFRANADGAKVLARAATEHSLAFLTFSSDQVFDGAKQGAYDEHDGIAPLNVLGRSKVAAERNVMDACPAALVVRPGSLFSPWSQNDFLAQTCSALNRGQLVHAAEDVIISPTAVPDLVHAALDLLIDRECGIWHLANGGSVSWAELARWTARLTGLDENLVIGCPQTALEKAAEQPANSALTSARGQLLSGLEEALQRYLYETGWMGAGHLAGTKSPISRAEELVAG